MISNLDIFHYLCSSQRTLQICHGGELGKMMLLDFSTIYEVFTHPFCHFRKGSSLFNNYFPLSL